MSTSEIIWGLAVLAAGVFICVYGSMLFRFALAAMGFGLGVVAGMRIFEGQDETARVLIAFVLGAICAAALFALVKFTFYIAGALLGLVLAFVVVGVIDIFTSRPDGWLQTVLGAGGALLGAFFGSRLGNIVVLLASASAGAFLIMDGLHVLFASQFNVDTIDPGSALAQKLSLTLFALIFAIAGLGQWNSRHLRQRVIS
jgi:hypothetical protein